MSEKAGSAALPIEAPLRAGPIAATEPMTTSVSQSPSVRRARGVRLGAVLVLGYLGLSALPHLSHGLHRGCARVRESIGYSLDKYDAAYFAEHVECPEQPEPLFPPVVWDLTDEEKEKSVELYSQAVVGAFEDDCRL